jgi:large subunit ribosomal protein L13
MDVVDASGCVAGRVASLVAKELLKGKEIAVVNAEKALITGNMKFIMGAFKEKVGRGDPRYGPFYPKTPDRILKRIIRGMLPYKKPRGREAMKRLKVYISVPEDLKDAEAMRLPGTGGAQERKCITLEKIARGVGGKFYA